MVLDIFRTKRLYFLPIEDNNDHNDILLRLRSGPLYANSTPTLPTPGGPVTTKKEVRDLVVSRGRVPLFICLNESETKPASEAKAPRTSDSASAPTTSGDAAPDAPAAPKPTIIGMLILGKPGMGFELSSHNSNGNIGLNVLQEYTGKGYGSEALEWLQWYAFTIVGLHRLGIGATGWNLGAQRMYQRAGFKVEGRERESIWFMGGWHDLALMGMLRAEWEEREREKGGGGYKRVEVGGRMGSEEVARIMGCD